MTRLHRLALLLSAGAASVAISPAVIAAPAFSVTGTPTALSNPPFTLGYSFSLSKSFTLTGLGVFDADGDGLLNDYDIGLYDTGGNLLVSTNLGAGTSGTLIDGFRYVALAPVALTAGDYRVGALFTNASGDDSLYFSGGGNIVSSISGVTYGDARFALGSTLSDPTVSAGSGDGYFGPNLLLQSGAAPEPASWALMLGGFGMIGGVLRGRRKMTVSFS